MQTSPFIHYAKDKKSLLNSYYLALLPLLIFGFYKNGILLYQNAFISFLDMFLPLYFYLISLIIGLIVSLIFKKNRLEMLLYALIIASSISPNTNLLIYPLVLFASLCFTQVLTKKFSFNDLALTRIIVVLALLINSYSYLNVAEKIDAFNYNLFDIFLGYGISGLASSSLFWLIITFLILAFNKFYKKIIPLTASLSYLIITLILFFVLKDNSYLTTILNGTVYFSFIFVGPHLYLTPNSKKASIIYGLAIGLTTALLSLIVPINEVGYLSIFLCSLFIPLFNNFQYKKDLHS